MRTVLLSMLLGAILGVVVASLVVPPWLAWYSSPGGYSPTKQVETLCNMPEVIRYASRWLLIGQAIGAVVGAIVFLFPGLALSRRGAAPAA